MKLGSLHHLSFLEEAILEQPLSLITVIESAREETVIAGRNYAQDMVVARPRKSGFIRRFDGTEGLVCNKFYQHRTWRSGWDFNPQFAGKPPISGRNWDGNLMAAIAFQIRLPVGHARRSSTREAWKSSPSWWTIWRPKKMSTAFPNVLATRSGWKRRINLCCQALFESLEEVAQRYGLDRKRLLADPEQAAGTLPNEGGV